MARLGVFAPDLPPHDHPGLVTAQNCYYTPSGYRPVKAPSAITAALPASWLGGGAFRGSGGVTALLAATTGGLYAYISGAWVLKSAGTFTQPWQFAQFGDLVICVNGGTPLKYTITTATAATLGGSPPAASMVTVFGDHVLLAGDSGNVKTFTVSALNNAEGWTIGLNGCDNQQLPDGGDITGVAGGEFALVAQSDAIHIIEPTDAPLYFTRRKIKSGLGCITSGSVAQFDNRVFFYARQGFHMFVAGEVQPIGLERVDSTFRTAYSLSDIQNNMRCVIDPERKLAIWSMVDKLWAYNWEDNAWTTVYIPGLVGISTGRTASVTLETIAVTYPAIESVPVSFDDPIWRGGEPMLLFAKTDKVLYTFGASTNLESTFRLTKQEFAKGRHAHVRNVTVDTDATSGCTVNLDTSSRLGDNYVRYSAMTMQPNGQMPIRAQGRYYQPEIVMTAGADWSFVAGLDLEATPGGVL